MEEKALQCQNCESKLESQFEFCPNCGQKTNDKLTIGVLFYNTISNYFSFDARFLKSFIPLMTKPGYLARKFLEGKRLLYLHPAQMYLFVSVIFFFLFSFTARKHTDALNTALHKTLEKDKVNLIDSVDMHKADSITRAKLKETLEQNQALIGVNDKEIDSIVASEEFGEENLSFGFNEKKVDSLIKINAQNAEIYKAMGMKDDDNWMTKKAYAQALKFYRTRDGGNILGAFYDTIPIALFFLLPIFAFIIKLLYRKKGHYAHHLVFSFYYFSFLFTVFSIIFGINMIYDISDSIDFLIATSTFIYLYIALKRFYGQGWILSFIKCGVATFSFIAIVIPSTVAILAVFAFLFY
ncbi:DUF3667 domain-containing protein [uncultured Psychroserpens sp.]|uniref:DUF3667 domain-containing protein n=1 Tax=uncultured Psychroserpens sp. TaxID=255436 RepID=UPI00262FBC40|nr:DUF3667 domain-containing protein [uncultured Psychroserpens sp.]